MDQLKNKYQRNLDGTIKFNYSFNNTFFPINDKIQSDLENAFKILLLDSYAFDKSYNKKKLKIDEYKYKCEDYVKSFLTQIIDIISKSDNINEIVIGVHNIKNYCNYTLTSVNQFNGNIPKFLKSNLMFRGFILQKHKSTNKWHIHVIKQSDWGGNRILYTSCGECLETADSNFTIFPLEYRQSFKNIIPGPCSARAMSSLLAELRQLPLTYEETLQITTSLGWRDQLIYEMEILNKRDIKNQLTFEYASNLTELLTKFPNSSYAIVGGMANDPDGPANHQIYYSPRSKLFIDDTYEDPIDVMIPYLNQGRPDGCFMLLQILSIPSKKYISHKTNIPPLIN